MAKARVHQMREQGGPQVEKCYEKRIEKHQLIQVEGRREVLALQVRARRMIEGYTK